jgi:hypothetical protein
MTLCTAILSVEERGEMWLLTDVHRLMNSHAVRQGFSDMDIVLQFSAFWERMKRAVDILG